MKRHAIEIIFRSYRFSDIAANLQISAKIFQFERKLGFWSTLVQNLLPVEMEQGRELSTNYCTTSMQFDVTFMPEKMKLTKT